MKKKNSNSMKVLSVVLSLLMVLSVISLPTLKAKAEEPVNTVDAFVERCYTVTLDRGSDPDGFADWKGQLLNGKAVGIEVAYGFLFSPEYTNKNKSNEDYVKDLYMLFLGRTPDEAGFNDWVGQLNEGKSRLDVYAGFANSVEFYNICTECGITAGRYVKGYDRATNNNVNLFVERLYKTCLGRVGDREGQKNWVEKLITKQISGTECARSFIFSQEYINKGLYDWNYVENLYLAMMGRPSDPEGKENWVNALENGKTRDEVFAGFANSAEFAGICAKYKIDKGSYTAKDIGQPNEPVEEETVSQRVSRVDYNNGQYVLYTYGSDGEEISEVRYKKNGTKLRYDYRDEPFNNGLEIYYCETYYVDGGLDYEFYQKTVYSSDKKTRKEYYYSDAWNTLESYDVYTDTEFSFECDGEIQTDFYPVKCISYDASNHKIGEKYYTYTSDHRLESCTEYFSGKISCEEEYEYYDKKPYGVYAYPKKETRTYYNDDGTISWKDEYEYNENENITKETHYLDGGAFDSKIVNQYDSNGRLIKETTYDAPSHVEHYIIFDLDYYGNNIKKTYFNASGKRETYTLRTYDANNHEIETICYDDGGTEMWRYEYEYDANGNKTREYYIENGGDEFEELYEYDENNDLKKHTKKYNGAEIFWEKYTYEEYTD